ncbi:MAG TPA: enoyl-CoA hydratase-related protein [Chloroflexota bacterium]|nr:enoyl-CoA hydratase-related protein [Chloroflexota bacterium]
MTRTGPDPEGAADGVILEVREAIALVTLDRPEVHNALNLAMWRRLCSVFRVLATTRGLRVVIVRGAGGRAFSAGADISEFRAARVGSQAAGVYNTAIASALQAIYTLPLPVIAVIEGLAVGGGCEIATACDLRIAGHAARFAIPIMRLGVSLGLVEAEALVRLIGPAHAKDLLFTGRMIGADEALRIGLVNRVVPDHELEQASWNLANRICQGAPLVAAAHKLALNGLVHGFGAAEAARLRRITTEIYEGSDLLEGIAAFGERRDPIFTGQVHD